MTDLKQSDRNYRRGAIMGLTMAEAFILIAFALLLLFAFWQWEVEKQNTPDVQAFKELTVEQRQTVRRFIDEDKLLRLTEKVASLPEDTQRDLAKLVESGQAEKLLSQMAALEGLTAEQRQTVWRFIDEDELQRLTEAVASLPEDIQRDLAKLVESGQAKKLLSQMAALEGLTAEQRQTVRRFIDEDELQRLTEKIASLPEDTQRDLAKLVESGQAEKLLREMAALERLTAEQRQTVRRFIDEDELQRLTEKVASLPEDTQKDLAKLVESGQAEKLLREMAALEGLTAEQRQTVWRFIDEDELQRLTEAVASLPEDIQRDLAKLVESGQAKKLLSQMAALEELVKAEQTLKDINREIKDAEAQLVGLGKAEQTLEDISGKIRDAEVQEAALVRALKSELGSVVANIGGHIDDTGAIILPDKVLFAQGKANITPTLSKILAKICQPWLSTSRNSGVDIAEVKIEGHASSEWRVGTSSSAAFLGNLDLSQRRSQAVLRTCLGIIQGQGLLDWARKHLIAVGYSSVRPVLGYEGKEDHTASRRVVFSATPNRKSLLEEIETEAKIAR